VRIWDLDLADEISVCACVHVCVRACVRACVHACMFVYVVACMDRLGMDGATHGCGRDGGRVGVCVMRVNWRSC
jgi:hypothetical protein